MENDKMPETEKKVSLETDPNAELLIGEVAQLTGYSVKTLQRLDGEKIPPSHRCDARNARVWFAKDVKKIIAYRKKMDEKRMKQVSKLYKSRKNGGADG